jgi:DDE family transposase
MQDLEQILAKFREIVSPNVCNKLAKRCGFVKRSTSQLEGYEFAQAMMIPNAFLEAETLNSLAVRMNKINPKCNLSAPALAQRINTEVAKAFMKACFAKVLSETMKKDFAKLPDLHNLSGFNRVLIEDSTTAELHEKLSPSFKGAGGSASESAVKINFVFDYLSEQIVDIEFCAGNIPDQALADKIILLLEKDDLVIRDLGYYALPRIKEIEQRKAYFISRLKINVGVYESKEALEPLDLAKFLDENAFQGAVDVYVFIGKERHPVRLVAYVMDEEAVNKRRRAVNKTARRKGRKISEKKSRLMKYAIFITNIPREILSGIGIMAAYRARWRVELIFKQWKSCLKLHIFKGYNKERFLCFLYGRLIMILLLGLVCSPLMQYALTLGRELSCHKLINYLIADHALARAIHENRLDGFLSQLYEDLPRRLCMDKRQRLSLRANVRTEQSYYKELAMTDLYIDAA